MGFDLHSAECRVVTFTYPWAAVSSPDRGTLWILSRDKRMPRARYDAIYDRLADRGFGPERMELTEQD